MQTQQDTWELAYLEALVAHDGSATEKYESLDFFTSLSSGRSGVRELLLYRLISRLGDTDDVTKLLHNLQNSEWEDYAPRALAKIADTDELVRNHPGLATLLERIYADRSGATNYSLSRWRLIGDADRLQRPKSPPWSRRVSSLATILQKKRHDNLSSADIKTVVDYFHQADVRIYSLAIVTFYELPTAWADTLHRVLAIPYMNVVSAPTPRIEETQVVAPSEIWAPQWQVRMKSEGWHVEETHTGAALRGLGTSAIYEVLAILLSLGGLLRDGIMSNPTTTTLVKALTISQPIWGFRDKQYAADGTGYRSFDIRALALGFLEDLPATQRVLTFRSRLAMNLVSMTWDRRKSASVVTHSRALYRELAHAAQLFSACQFEEVIGFVSGSSHEGEPALQNLVSESESAIAMLDEAQHSSRLCTDSPVQYPERILCVTHASVPYQTGGYAIRAHGILSELRQNNVDVIAVTRPGFPDGPLTDDTVETIDDVDYLRLSATTVNRAQGEMQHMQSYIQKFEELFERQQVGKIHVRSTFLIALPALIAARRLGLPVLYEVSGLWELVYRDREHESHLLKRSYYAELAESATMRNVDRLVVMNEAVQQIAIDRGVEPERIAIAPNAVNVDRFKPLAPLATAAFTIGYLGSFVDYEGLDLLLDVVRIFIDAEQPVRLLMVGDGTKFAAIQSRVRKEGLEDYVKLTGRVSHQEVLAMYEQMDALVYPRISTNATEAITPLKPFEALAMEKPIVVSDVKPLKEIVGNDERGLAFEAGNAQDLTRAVSRLAADPSLGQRLGRAGREWVSKDRNWKTVVETFLQSYAELER